MSDMTIYRIDLPYRRPPLNHNHRYHWRAESRLKAQIRRDVAWLAKAAKIPHANHIIVQLHYAPGRHGKQDPMNWCRTTKPAIDGIQDAGVVINDDSRHVHELEPEIHFPPESGPRCWLTIRIDPSTNEETLA